MCNVGGTPGPRFLTVRFHNFIPFLGNLILNFVFCFLQLQDMKSAVITPCSHFFHAACLKKWLYVQETCPLCHGQLKSQLQPTSSPGAPTQDTANQNPEGVEQEQSQPQVELNTEEGTQAEDTPPMKTSAEQKLGMDLLSGSLKTQPKECDLVAKGSAGTAGDDDHGSCSTSDVHCIS